MHEQLGSTAAAAASYSARVDNSGRIVIPAELRERLHFRPGDELVLRETAGSLSVRSYDQALAEAQAYFGGLVEPGVSAVDELLAERRAEVSREAAKDADRDA